MRIAARILGEKKEYGGVWSEGAAKGGEGEQEREKDERRRWRRRKRRRKRKIEKEGKSRRRMNVVGRQCQWSSILI